jgi:hypothetical protein
MTNIISLDDTPSVPTPAQVMAPRPEAPLGVAPRPVAPSWASTFGSSFARENTVANVMSFGEGPARLADQDIPEDWNPVAFARSSWDKERFDKLRPFVSDGVFNYATNPSEVEWIANRIETRLRGQPQPPSSVASVARSSTCRPYCRPSASCGAPLR